MGEVTVRRAGPDDAFVVAALRLQSARDVGTPSEAGFLNRFVDAWLAECAHRPTWVAQREGDHAGLLETSRLRTLPWPARAASSVLTVENLFVVPAHRGHGVEHALVDAVTAWSHRNDVTTVRVSAADAGVRGRYEGVGFRVVATALELDLDRPG